MGCGSGELTVEAVEQGGVLSDVVGCGGCSCKKKGGVNGRCTSLRVPQWRSGIRRTFTPGNGGEGGGRWERSRGPGHRRPRLQAGPRRVRLSGPPPPAGDATASGEGPQTLAARRDAERMRDRCGSGRAARWGNMREGGGSAGWLSAVRLGCRLVMACRSAGLNG